VSRFSKYAWSTLAYNFVVVLWGAYVRASGSGAGCGAHWPTCNGEILPRAPAIETLIEFTHRLTSGLALVLTIGLVVAACRTFTGGHRARKAAWTTLGFMIAEALLGAGLVLFGLVDDDDSLARAMVMCMHLINTLFLLGFMALTAWWADRPGKLDLHQPAARGLGLATAGLLLLGITGAIAALGDTLFPATSLVEGFQADMQTGAHILLRLRGLHPVFAIIVAFGLVHLANGQRAVPHMKTSATLLMAAVLTQIVVGFVNLGLLAPIPLQLLHLFMADGLWVLFLVFAAKSLETSRPGQAQRD
jgi:cytochrome c oxidase assembly protein subunit 15